MKALILAAGYATRLYPLTINTPKALLPILGRPIIDYITDEIDTIKEIDEIIVISNDRYYNNFAGWAQTRQKELSGKLTILNDGTTTDEDKRGAIGDIWFTVESRNIDEDIVVIAGDNLFTYKLKDSYDAFIKERLDMVLAKKMLSRSDLQRMAVGLLDNDDIIIDMEEKPQEPKSDIAFYATYFYKRETIPLIKQYLDEGHTPDAPGNFPAWLYKQKPVKAFLFDGECIDIGTPEAYADVEKLFFR